MDYLKEHKIDFELRDYQQDVLDKEELRAVCEKLNVSPEAVVRKNEKLFQEQFAQGNYSDEEWLDILVAHPVLLQRPIVINGNQAVVARPAEAIEKLLD